jgi:hypothetical protein
MTSTEGSGSFFTSGVTCASGAVGRSDGSDFFRQEIELIPAKHPAIASQAVGFMVAGYAFGGDPRQGSGPAAAQGKPPPGKARKSYYVPEVVDVSVEVEVSVVVGVSGVVGVTGTCAARNNWNQALANPVGT